MSTKASLKPNGHGSNTPVKFGQWMLEQFQEKSVTVFRPDLRNFKELDQFDVSMKQ
ncbi:hypothetical protein GGE07_001024 [Sinorhizobium terangae]|uniref:Uncharacterized protein n=1 Tax=Sinorhizobium terangae TaxID=110322 RepID=A0A6N7LPL3_SINTE|nr:hypothetical protein [Sinorhizobium terangae]MBB4184398.1 hypothetical protein [Sinorhizobium terangae]MQX19110.1 hypothetical protein [Sinorhizobium terangae]